MEQLLTAVAAGSDAAIEFAKDESHLFFQVGHRLLISRILTGQFPNYEAVLPRDNNKRVVIERAERRPADPEARHASDGGDRWPPPGACGDRSQTCGHVAGIETDGDGLAFEFFLDAFFGAVKLAVSKEGIEISASSPESANNPTSA